MSGNKNKATALYYTHTDRPYTPLLTTLEAQLVEWGQAPLGLETLTEETLTGERRERERERERDGARARTTPHRS